MTRALETFLREHVTDASRRAAVAEVADGLVDLRNAERIDLEDVLKISEWPAFARNRFLQAWQGLRDAGRAAAATADNADLSRLVGSQTPARPELEALAPAPAAAPAAPAPPPPLPPPPLLPLPTRMQVPGMPQHVILVNTPAGPQPCVVVPGGVRPIVMPPSQIHHMLQMQAHHRFRQATGAPDAPHGNRRQYGNYRKAVEIRRVGDASWRRFGRQKDAAEAFGISQGDVTHLIKDRSKVSARVRQMFEARSVDGNVEDVTPEAAAPPVPMPPEPTPADPPPPPPPAPPVPAATPAIPAAPPPPLVPPDTSGDEALARQLSGASERRRIETQRFSSLRDAGKTYTSPKRAVDESKVHATAKRHKSLFDDTDNDDDVQAPGNAALTRRLGAVESPPRRHEEESPRRREKKRCATTRAPAWAAPRIAGPPPCSSDDKARALAVDPAAIREAYAKELRQQGQRLVAEAERIGGIAADTDKALAALADPVPPPPPAAPPLRTRPVLPSPRISYGRLISFDQQARATYAAAWSTWRAVGGAWGERPENDAAVWRAYNAAASHRTPSASIASENDVREEQGKAPKCPFCRYAGPSCKCAALPVPPAAAAPAAPAPAAPASQTGPSAAATASPKAAAPVTPPTPNAKAIDSGIDPGEAPPRIDQAEEIRYFAIDDSGRDRRNDDEPELLQPEPNGAALRGQVEEFTCYF